MCNYQNDSNTKSAPTDSRNESLDLTTCMCLQASYVSGDILYEYRSGRGEKGTAENYDGGKKVEIADQEAKNKKRWLKTGSKEG